MAVALGYILTLLVAVIGGTSFLPSLLGGFLYRWFGPIAWMGGAFAGGLITWIAISWLWRVGVDGYPNMPIAAAGGVLLSHLAQTTQWEHMNDRAKVAMGGEFWSLILFAVVLLLEPSTPWF